MLLIIIFCNKKKKINLFVLMAKFCFHTTGNLNYLFLGVGGELSSGVIVRKEFWLTKSVLLQTFRFFSPV